ncbi:hypothetical protein BDV12DRAFT_202247 [Aspergillus spectabilis]
MANYTLHIGIQPKIEDRSARWVVVLVHPQGKECTWYCVIGGPHDNSPYVRVELPRQNFFRQDFAKIIPVGMISEDVLQTVDEIFGSIQPMQNQFFALDFLDRLMWRLTIEPTREVWDLWSRAEFSVLEWRERGRFGRSRKMSEPPSVCPEYYQVAEGFSDRGGGSGRGDVVGYS